MINARRHMARIAGISCIAALAAGTIGVASAEAAPMVQHQAAAYSTSHDGNNEGGAGYHSNGQGGTLGNVGP
ncbi:hypothetical protein ABT131_08750 [Streptomyces sp900105245]|uniref:hypothetical protein n=1 Tax=Streptomyces sp. 900105245 TaxID=3154379 RepID=UPI003333BBDF